MGHGEERVRGWGGEGCFGREGRGGQEGGICGGFDVGEEVVGGLGHGEFPWFSLFRHWYSRLGLNHEGGSLVTEWADWLGE